jgi:hypothetical protein
MVIGRMNVEPEKTQATYRIPLSIAATVRCYYHLKSNIFLIILCRLAIVS